MNNISLCIIDCIGLPYDGNTLTKKGLGGQESAVILMAKELQQIGFDVTVFNDCNDTDIKPGRYNGVVYRPITDINENDYFDIMIQSRTIIPFVPEPLYKMFMPDQYGRMHNPKIFEKLRNTARHKILWKHDTFCMGDPMLEDLVLQGFIDEIFTLSDFHTVYITNSDHGKKRNFEVLKRKVFQTRNGIINYKSEVDIQNKDKDLFVYNASISKGMIPLVNEIWPMIKQRIPTAKLKVIGGYYKFKDSSNLDEQEIMWRQLVEQTENTNLDIEFTGIITQAEIAEILSKAYMFLYPGTFPETFGIQTLESLNYNTPLVTTRFGALEETAIQDISYFIDYAIEPTVLTPHIDKTYQNNVFVTEVVNAYNNSYLHQQKMHMCDIVKDVSTWDTVALQWKQHFYRILNKHLPVSDFRKVKKINKKVSKIFGRRFTNKEDITEDKTPENLINVIVPFYNSEHYIKKTIESVVSQDYNNYQCYLIDDAQTDQSSNVIHKFIESLDAELKSKFHIITNGTNMGAVYNQISTIRNLEDSIVILLDGDDWLAYRNDIFDFYNNMYNEGAEFTYGSCWSLADNIPLVAQTYPQSIKNSKAYREHKFNWNMPYPHLRTFKKSLLDNIDDNVFKDENGIWYKAGGDNAVFYNIIEQADPNKIIAVKDIHYIYNDLNPLNDYKVNSIEQNDTATKIISKEKTLKTILIAIPTAKNIEAETFKSIYDLKIPDGYKVDFQYFYGYNISQIRNLISQHVITGYDYLFAVDQDMAFDKYTLKRMLETDKDIVTGIYRQRKENEVLEIYLDSDIGMRNASFSELKNKGLVEVSACGFGCILIRSQVLTDIGYPQFEYKMKNVYQILYSEDVDFCIKAKSKGYKIWCDTSTICDHIGSTVYKIDK